MFCATCSKRAGKEGADGYEHGGGRSGGGGHGGSGEDEGRAKRDEHGRAANPGGNRGTGRQQPTTSQALAQIEAQAQATSGNSKEVSMVAQDEWQTSDLNAARGVMLHSTAYITPKERRTKERLAARAKAAARAAAAAD